MHSTHIHIHTRNHTAEIARFFLFFLINENICHLSLFKQDVLAIPTFSDILMQAIA